MKKIFFAATLLIIAVACGSKFDGYTIKGTIDGVADGQQIILLNRSRTAPFADTAMITKGKFTFTGKVSTPEFYTISVDDKALSLFVDNSTITIKGHIDSLGKATVKGSPLCNAIEEMGKKKDKINEEFEAKYHTKALLAEYNAQGTTAERKAEIAKAYSELEDVLIANTEEIEAIDSQYMAQNPTSPYTVVLVQQNMRNMEFAKLAAYVETFTNAPELADNRIVAELQKTVETLEKIQIGKPAPDFTQNDPDGKPISLSSVYAKNKITMIDFWASWCGPCRRFNPTLVEVYQKYHKKGFEIFAVSFDRPTGKEDWIKAIKDDKLSWVHVSVLQFWDNDARHLYNVNSIPANVFIDQNGTIVARQLHGKEEIEKFLNEKL